MINPDDIRRELERELGRTLPEAAWDFLVERGWVRDVGVGAMTIHGLAKHVRAHERAWGGPTTARTMVPRMLASAKRGKPAETAPARQEVVSRLLAAEAAEDKEVRSFREEELGGSLMKPQDVDRWIARQAKKDGPPSRWLTVTLPTGYEVRLSPTFTFATTEPPLTISEKTPAILVHKRYLSYLRYGVDEVEEDPTGEVPTAEGGVLDRLRQLSQSLARFYGWDEAAATNFVLTGEVPFMPSIETRSWVPSAYRTLARISLTIDPALSPRKVADHYRRIRGRILGGRHRELSAKHVRLAIFVAGRPTRESWRERMIAWNKEYPNWSYRRETNFNRDWKQAIQRLLHPDYGPKIEL
jgi:hypothetical protein